MQSMQSVAKLFFTEYDKGARILSHIREEILRGAKARLGSN
jgi:hypothetical protein